jgi:hypothetical protein
MALSESCSFCGNDVPSPSQHCPHCGQPGKFWNVIAANQPEEREALDRRYRASYRDANSRMAELVLQDFENAGANSKVVVARSEFDVFRLATSTRQLHANYYQLIESGLRLPDGDEWDALREPADSVLFPHYKDQVTFGALSLDGDGLPHYGSCSITLRDSMIAHRASVFEENSTLFVKRRGVAKARKAKGYRATWTDRKKLCVAKLHGKIDSTTRADKYSEILLRQGIKPEDDEFVEVHIWGPFSVRTMERVIVMAPNPSKRATITRAIKSILSKNNVQVN